jgi:hypothetical protein
MRMLLSLSTLTLCLMPIIRSGLMPAKLNLSPLLNMWSPAGLGALVSLSTSILLVILVFLILFLIVSAIFFLLLS